MSATKELSRIEAFSDGVFAIAVTLLILEIRVPLEHVDSPEALRRELWMLWPSYFAFVYSFGTIFIAWVNHHQLFLRLAKMSQPFIYANAFLLLSVTFLPFPTAVLARYLMTDKAQPAIAFFCLSALVQNFSWVLLIESAAPRTGLMKAGAEKSFGVARRALYAGLTIYVATAILAWWFPIPALMINTAVWLLWISLGLVLKPLETA